MMSSITVHTNQKQYIYPFSPGTKLLELLRREGFAVSAPCGGKGKCRNCRVLFRAGGREAYVLACQTILTEDCEVFFTASGPEGAWKTAEEQLPAEPGRSGLGAAVDLGSTTVCAALYDLGSGKLLGHSSRFNAQRSYGADVISRISFCMESEDGLSRLSACIRSQISEMLAALCREKGGSPGEIREGFLAGNTVMEHIFAGISPVSIARAPYLPLSLFDQGETVRLGEIPFALSPCIAGYVGGDITAGLFCDAVQWTDREILFIDVGTNGEIVLGNRQRFSACAVASGPAFEGAGIECGMPAAAGAVNRVELTEEGLSFEVIGGGQAKGICGSGLLDLTACLLEAGIIDEGGRLETEDGERVFPLTDTVFLSQKDVRQLQLAKAAVSAGILRLMQTQGLGFDEISCVYLAGGFGTRLRPESAVRIGMLPKELAGKILPLGNAALTGASKALLSPAGRQELAAVKNSCTYLELSTDPEFYSCYTEEMCFPSV